MCLEAFLECRQRIAVPYRGRNRVPNYRDNIIETPLSKSDCVPWLREQVSARSRSITSHTLLLCHWAAHLLHVVRTLQGRQVSSPDGEVWGPAGLGLGAGVVRPLHCWPWAHCTAARCRGALLRGRLTNVRLQPTIRYPTRRGTSTWLSQRDSWVDEVQPTESQPVKDSVHAMFHLAPSGPAEWRAHRVLWRDDQHSGVSA